MTDLRDKIAAQMWRTHATDVGAPESVATARTPEAFADESDSTRATWLRQADAIIVALPGPVWGVGAVEIARLRRALDLFAKHRQRCHDWDDDTGRDRREFDLEDVKIMEHAATSALKAKP